MLTSSSTALEPLDKFKQHVLPPKTRISHYTTRLSQRTSQSWTTRRQAVAAAATTVSHLVMLRTVLIYTSPLTIHIQYLSSSIHIRSSIVQSRISPLLIKQSSRVEANVIRQAETPLIRLATAQPRVTQYVVCPKYTTAFNNTDSFKDMLQLRPDWTSLT